MLPKNEKQSKTPQPMKGKRRNVLITPKSAPPQKRKNIKDSMDTDDTVEFEKMLKALKGKAKETPLSASARKAHLLGKGGSEESEDDVEYDMEDEDDEGGDDDDDDDSGDESGEELGDSDDEEDEDSDDEDEDDSEEDLDPPVQKKKSAPVELSQSSNKKKQVKKQVSQPSAQASIKLSTSQEHKVTSQESLVLSSKEVAADIKRREERDRRSLFIKIKSMSITKEDLKKLSPDIEEVQLKVHRKGSRCRGFAFLGFKDEKTAEEHFKRLQGIKIKDQTIIVDFVGVKSKHKREHKKLKLLKPEEIDPTKLYVTGFDEDMTSEKLNRLFPKAYNVTLPIRGMNKKPIGYGFVHFATEEDAKQAHDGVQDKITAGHRLTVLFAKKVDENKIQKRKQPENNKKQGPPQKKMKTEVKAEEAGVSDEDEEDEDEDDEEEDEGEEDEDVEEEEEEEDDDIEDADEEEEVVGEQDDDEEELGGEQDDEEEEEVEEQDDDMEEEEEEELEEQDDDVEEEEEEEVEEQDDDVEEEEEEQDDDVEEEEEEQDDDVEEEEEEEVEEQDDDEEDDQELDEDEDDDDEEEDEDEEEEERMKYI